MCIVCVLCAYRMIIMSLSRHYYVIDMILLCDDCVVVMYVLCTYYVITM